MIDHLLRFRRVLAPNAELPSAIDQGALSVFTRSPKICTLVLYIC